MNAASFQMTSRQKLVHSSLAQKNQEVVDLYECALRVFNDDANAGRISLAAHAIRELIDALSKIMDVPIMTERLGDQVGALQPIWNKALQSSCQRGGTWAGEIDAPLQRLLKQLHKFFTWYERDRPKRRDAAATLFRRTDPAGLCLPENLETRRVNRWLVLHDYFVGVAHRATTTPQEFLERTAELEQFLLETIYRQPSADFSAIDAILGEATE